MTLSGCQCAVFGSLERRPLRELAIPRHRPDRAADFQIAHRAQGLAERTGLPTTHHLQARLGMHKPRHAYKLAIGSEPPAIKTHKCKKCFSSDSMHHACITAKCHWCTQCASREQCTCACKSTCVLMFVCTACKRAHVRSRVCVCRTYTCECACTYMSTWICARKGRTDGRTNARTDIM